MDKQLDEEIIATECTWCEHLAHVEKGEIERQRSKFGGFFCTPDCKSDYVHAEFNFLMQQPCVE